VVRSCFRSSRSSSQGCMFSTKLSSYLINMYVFHCSRKTRFCMFSTKLCLDSVKQDVQTKRNETIQKRLGGSRCVLLFQFAHGKPRTGDKFSQRLSKTLVPPRKVAKATTTLSSGAAHNLARPYLNRICSIGSYRCILYYKGGKHSSLVDDL
jgi:hypothetical protein